MHQLARCGAIFLSSTFCAACTDYDYRVSPGGQAPSVPIRSDNDTEMDIDPLQYHMQSASGRLVLFIYNPTPDAIKLVGSKSTVTDPDGVAHPMISQLIPPNGSIKMLIPPELPEASREADTGAAAQPPGPFQANDQPGYIVPSGADNLAPGPQALDDPHYWTWSAPGPVNLRLTYVRKGQTFAQSLTVGRKRK
jgi:hypothetical protein